MSVLLINLRHAPEDEIADIRDILDERSIEYYETKAGAWGVSAPGIWLNEKSDLAQAKILLDEYQEQRCREQRAEYERLKQAGLHPTFLQNLQQQPFLVILYGLFIAMILYISIRPFIFKS